MLNLVYRRIPIFFIALCFVPSFLIDVYADENEVPAAQIQSFVETFETIREGYVDVLSDEEIVHKALKGMVSRLDPHSEYFTKDELIDFDAQTSGHYAGVGIEVELRNDDLIVVTPIDGSPAKEAGILSGDIVVRIDNVLINSLGMQDIVDLIRGEEGSAVTLDISRDGDIKQYELERRLIDESSVSDRWLEGDIAYLRISQFQRNSAEEFSEAVTKLKKKQDMQGVILDLRNNPGGILKSAVDIVDVFLDEGLIVYTQGRDALPTNRFLASKASTILPNTPIIVLINDGSASASEIVAGAIQDHGRGLILGTESFGKGSVQTVIPLSNGDAVKLTTALYYTPNGRSIQAQGITPDLIVPQASLTLEEGHFSIKESELQGHLENGTGGVERNSDDAKLSLSELAQTDFQLYQALSILKTLPTLTQNSK